MTLPQPSAYPMPVDAYYAPAPRRPRTLGVVAFAIAAGVFVLSVIASTIVGTTAGPLATTTGSSFTFNTSDLTPEQAAAFEPVGLLMGAQILLGTLLGVGALVLGIIAAATARGRAFGVAVIVIAALAPIVSFAVYVGTLAATLH